MLKKLNIGMACLLICLLGFVGCGDSSSDGESKSGANDIKSFIFSASIKDNIESGITTDAQGSISGTDIQVKIPQGADLSKLVPVFTVSENSSVTVNNQNVESGKTELDFTSPVNFDVKAENGSTKNFKITVGYAVSYSQKIDSGVFGVAAIKYDGTVLFAPNPKNGQGAYFKQEYWKNIKYISVGYSGMVGATADGRVVHTSKWFGTRQVSNWTDIIQVDIGESFIVGLKSDGTVVVEILYQGNVSESEFLDEIKSWKNIAQISVGVGDAILGLTKDGYVHFAANWADHSMKDISSEEQQWASSLNNIVKIDVGGDTYACLKKDGSVVGIIDIMETSGSESGLVPFSFGNDVIDIASGLANVVGLKGDGHAVAYGDNTYGQCNVSGLTNLVDIAAYGDYFMLEGTSNGAAAWSIGVKKDGSIVVAGDNPFPEILSWNLKQ